MPNDGGPKRPRIYDDDDEDDAPTRIMMRPLAFPRPSPGRGPESKRAPESKKPAPAAPKAAAAAPAPAAPRPATQVGRPLSAQRPAPAPTPAPAQRAPTSSVAAPSQLRRLSAPPPSNRKPPLGALGSTMLTSPSRESARPPPVAKRTAGEVLSQRQKPSHPPAFEGTMVMEHAPLRGLQPGAQLPAPSARPPPVQARPQQFQQPVQYSPQPPAVQYGQHSPQPPMVHSPQPQPVQYGHGRVYAPHLSPSAPQVFVPAGAPALVRALESGVDGAVDRGLELPTSTGSLIGWIAYTTPLLIATLAVASLALK